jgi:hypothetical protein
METHNLQVWRKHFWDLHDLLWFLLLFHALYIARRIPCFSCIDNF